MCVASGKAVLTDSRSLVHVCKTCRHRSLTRELRAQARAPPTPAACRQPSLAIASARHGACVRVRWLRLGSSVCACCVLGSRVWACSAHCRHCGIARCATRWSKARRVSREMISDVT